MKSHRKGLVSWDFDSIVTSSALPIVPTMGNMPEGEIANLESDHSTLCRKNRTLILETTFHLLVQFYTDPDPDHVIS